MSTKLQAYSNYLTTVCGLLGVPTSRLSTEIAAALNGFWNTEIQKVWNFHPWEDICPYGEARFVGNKFGYTNDLTQTSEWTATNLTITANSIANPLDGNVNASKLLETTTNGVHGVGHSAVSIIPSTTYAYSFLIRPNGRSWAYLKIDDGSLVHSCFFNVTTGALGTALNCTGQMQNVGQGFYYCSIQFTTSTSISATTSSITLQTSTDGSTLSYAGDVTKGLYAWGALLQQTTNTGITDMLVAYDQTGEERLDTVFQVWADSPFNSSLPREQGYTLTTKGIQIISGTVVNYAVVNSAGVTITTPQANPVFIYYRKSVPSYTGNTYSSTATYAVGDQVYYTSTAGTSDYWKCIVATTAGQSPDTTPASWSKLEIPDALFWPAVYFAYADWLLSDGQQDKAGGMFQLAETKLADQIERETRQQARTGLPLRVSTHVSSRGTPY